MQFEEELNKALQEQHEQFQAKRKKFMTVNEKLAKQVRVKGQGPQPHAIFIFYTPPTSSTLILMIDDEW